MLCSLYRPVTGRARLRCPYYPNNRSWLTHRLHVRPTFDHATKSWLIARAKWRQAVQLLAQTFGECIVELEHRQTDRCDARCQTARGDDCVCSCLGAYHGGGAPTAGWLLVGDTTLVGSVITVRRFRVLASSFGGRRPRGQFNELGVWE